MEGLVKRSLMGVIQNYAPEIVQEYYLAAENLNRDCGKIDLKLGSTCPSACSTTLSRRIFGLDFWPRNFETHLLMLLRCKRLTKKWFMLLIILIRRLQVLM